ncbi:MAG: hypothetical protein H5T50_00930 [Nitrososphaeria archaeon]|nr:hypothetical protein [Nitrososphaeria archaeon]
MMGKPAALAIISFIILSTLPISYTIQSPEYYENITLYVVGKNVLVRYNFTGTEVGLIEPKILEEKFSGVDYFKLYVSQFDSFPTEYAYFSSIGYNILLCEYNIPSAAILYVHSKTVQEASSFSEEIENRTGLSFTYYGKNGEMFMFISPSSFVDVLENFLWKIIPTTYGGFTKLLDKRDVTFSAIREIGFIGKMVNGKVSQSIIVDILKTNAFSGNSLRTGLDIFLSSRVNSSDYTNLGNFKIISYGQIIEKSDAGYVKNDFVKKISELTITVPGNDVLHFPNITLAKATPSIIVEREFSKTALKFGEEFEVQVRVRNIGAADAENIKFEDSWWIGGGAFTLTAGKYSDQVSKLGPGENRTIVYRLKVQTRDTVSFYIRPLNITYFWNVSGERLAFNAVSNDAYMLLNQDGPSIYIIATLSTSQTSFGFRKKVTLDIKNRGSLTAFNITLYGESIEFLPPQESVQKVIEVDLENMSQPFKEEMFRCQWSNGKEVKGSVSNNIVLANSYDKMGITVLSLQRNIGQIISGDKIYLNMTLNLRSFGSKSVSNITVWENIPKGIKYVNGSLKQDEKGLYVFEESIGANSSKMYKYLFMVEDLSKNYVLGPAYAEYFLDGKKYSSLSTLNDAPIGLKITLHLDENNIFQNYSVNGYYSINNLGDKNVYRVSAKILYNPSINITMLSNPTNTSILKSGFEEKVYFKVNGKNLGLNNSVNLNVRYFFGGRQYNVNSTTVYVNVYTLPEIVFNVFGEAVEGKPFELKITVKNTAPLEIENIHFKILIPPQIKIIENLSPSTAKISNNTIEASIQKMGESSEETIILRLISGTAREYTLSSSELSFTYKGESITAPSQTAKVKVSDDIVSRYFIPLTVAIILMVAGRIALGLMKRGKNKIF